MIHEYSPLESEVAATSTWCKSRPGQAKANITLSWKTKWINSSPRLSTPSNLPLSQLSTGAHSTSDSKKLLAYLINQEWTSQASCSETNYADSLQWSKRQILKKCVALSTVSTIQKQRKSLTMNSPHQCSRALKETFCSNWLPRRKWTIHQKL